MVEIFLTQMTAVLLSFVWVHHPQVLQQLLLISKDCLLGKTVLALNLRLARVVLDVLHCPQAGPTLGAEGPPDLLLDLSIFYYFLLLGGRFSRSLLFIDDNERLELKVDNITALTVDHFPGLFIILD